VRKSSSAEVEEGSLGATVDLQTGRPFSYGDFELSVSGQAVWNDLSQKVTPRAALLVSKTILDGKLGFLVSAAYSRRNLFEEGFSSVRCDNGPSVGGFCSPTGVTPVVPNTGAICGAAPTGTPRLPDTAANRAAYAAASNAANFHPRLPRYGRLTHEQDRIGLVAFAGEALTQVPLTFDYDVLEQAILDLRIGALEDGTAIGSGLATAVNRLRAAPDTSKVVVLLSDGENNRGRIDPRTAAAAAASLGVKVYTIGVGTEGEAPIPTGRGVGGFRYEVLPVRIDEALLTDIAAKTGGRYFRARDAAALAGIFGQIDRLERTTSRVTRYTRRDEATWPFAAATLACLALELALSATVLVRAP